MGMTTGTAAALPRIGAPLAWPSGVRADRQTRQEALATFGWGTIALVALQGLVALLAYFWPRRTSAFGSAVSVGRPEEYAVGDIKYVVEGRFYLSRVAEGFIALYQKCPHLGCTVQWMPAREEVLDDKSVVRGVFRCPCHGSTYLQNGQVIIGPAPRPMDYFPITLRDGRLLVDTGKATRRLRWQPEQALPV